MSGSALVVPAIGRAIARMSATSPAETDEQQAASEFGEAFRPVEPKERFHECRISVTKRVLQTLTSSRYVRRVLSRAFGKIPRNPSEDLLAGRCR